MEDHIQHLKSYLEPESGGPAVEKIRTQEVASLAMTVYVFLDYMFEEIEYAGFQGVEYLEKCELFLKAVTPNYPQRGFDQILETLSQIDSRFPRTKFFQGFQGLRSLCSGDSGRVIELVQQDGKTQLTDTKQLPKDLILFGTFLIEKMVRMIKQLRSLKESNNWTILDIRKKIDDHFDQCVVQTVSSL